MKILLNNTFMIVILVSFFCSCATDKQVLIKKNNLKESERIGDYKSDDEDTDWRYRVLYYEKIFGTIGNEIEPVVQRIMTYVNQPNLKPGNEELLHAKAAEHYFNLPAELKKLGYSVDMYKGSEDWTHPDWYADREKRNHNLYLGLELIGRIWTEEDESSGTRYCSLFTSYHFSSKQKPAVFKEFDDISGMFFLFREGGLNILNIPESDFDIESDSVKRVCDSFIALQKEKKEIYKDIKVNFSR